MLPSVRVGTPTTGPTNHEMEKTLKLCANCGRQPVHNDTHQECRACYQHRYRHGTSRPAQLYSAARARTALAMAHEMQATLIEQKRIEAQEMAAAKRRDPHLAAFLNRIHTNRKAAA